MRGVAIHLDNGRGLNYNIFCCEMVAMDSFAMDYVGLLDIYLAKWSRYK